MSLSGVALTLRDLRLTHNIMYFALVISNLVQTKPKLLSNLIVVCTQSQSKSEPCFSAFVHWTSWQLQKEILQSGANCSPVPPWFNSRERWQVSTQFCKLKPCSQGTLLTGMTKAMFVSVANSGKSSLKSRIVCWHASSNVRFPRSRSDGLNCGNSTLSRSLEIRAGTWSPAGWLNVSG